MSSPLRMAVIAREQTPRVQDVWRELEPVLRRRKKIQLTAVAVTRDLSPEESDVDIALVLGGDGAILRACRVFGDRQAPILGINLGRLGFLNDLTADEFLEQLPRIEARDYRVVQHLMYECLHTRGDSVDRHLGLNEVSILSGACFQMIDVELAIEGRPVTTYSCDGLIISTPVGSTAHSLSAGGPILQQDLSAFVLTPICPHTLSKRPLVDSADLTYTLRVPQAPIGTTIVIDGQIRVPLTPTDSVTVRRAPVSFQLVRLPGHSYYATLQRKLGWGGQPQYRKI